MMNKEELEERTKQVVEDGWRKMKVFWKQFIQQIHFYPDKTEALVKTLILIISWGGGIYILRERGTVDGLGSAYLIFALSILMEFSQKCLEDENMLVKILHGAFIGAAALVLLVSIAILMGIQLANNHTNLMYHLTIGIMGYLIIDAAMVWMSNGNSIDKQVKPIVIDEELVKIFNEKLLGSSLDDREEKRK